MGGSTSVPQVLPQIWQRINDSHLRHRHTLEIIEQHHLRSPSQEDHTAVLAALAKRIALHHPAVPRLIYFRQRQADGLCSALGSEYTVVLYCEYRGDSLERVVEEKGERVYHSPCQCLQFLGAVQYLRDHYGCFAVTPQMVFLGSRRERMGKVWMHSRIEQSHPEFPASEQEMCLSLSRLFLYMRSQRICLAVTQEQLQAASGFTQLNELKNYIVSLHKASLNAPQAMPQRKKANSQSSSVRQDAGLQYFSQRTDKSQTQTRIPVQDNNVNAKPKIQFVYRTHHAAPQPIPTFTLPLHQEPNTTKPQAQMDNERSQRQQFSPIAINPPSQQVSQLNSITVSPETRDQDKQSNFNIREIQLPLKEMEDKGTSSRLPTTSRSPKRHKELVFNPIQEVPELNERRFTSQECRPRKRIEKTVSLHSSGNKFEKYRDAIRNYEQKLRQKFANSTGSNPLTAKRKTDLVFRPPVVLATPSKTPSKGEYKEAESLYNSSENEEKQTSLANEKNLQQASKEPQDRGESLRDLQLTNEHSQDEQRQNKRLREHLQKLQLEKDLQKEKALINSEMQDLLRQGGAKDEYRSIRDKIKQKKETFAQLKAEAAKILEDLDY